MDTKFDFMGYRKIAAGISIVLVLLSIVHLPLTRLSGASTLPEVRWLRWRMKTLWILKRFAAT